MADGSLGLRIKRARERRRMTQAQLASAIGVTQKTIDNWEHDKRYPKSSIGALEHVLGTRLDEPEPPPRLPPLVAENQDDAEVMAIWAITTMPQDTRLGFIAQLLARRPRRDDGQRRPGSA